MSRSRGGLKIALAFATLILLTSVANAASPQDVLWRDSSSSDQYPMWVPVGEAFSPSGELSTAMFSLPSISGLESAYRDMRRRGEACAGFVAAGHAYPTALAQAADRALTVLELRVMSLEEGFLFGAPGTLAQADIVGELKGRLDSETTSVFFFYPQADIETDALRLCPRPLHSDHILSEGDELMLMADFVTWTRGGDALLQPTARRDLIWKTESGGVTVPSYLTDAVEYESFDTLREALRAIVKQQEEKN